MIHTGFQVDVSLRWAAAEPAAHGLHLADCGGKTKEADGLPKIWYVSLPDCDG